MVSKKRTQEWLPGLGHKMFVRRNFESLSRRQHRDGGPSLAAQTWTGNGCPENLRWMLGDWTHSGCQDKYTKMVPR